MACHKNKAGVICLPNVYSYRGYIFENHSWCGPIRLRRDWETSTILGEMFLTVFEEWQKLSDSEKKATQIYG